VPKLVDIEPGLLELFENVTGVRFFLRHSVVNCRTNILWLIYMARRMNSNEVSKCIRTARHTNRRGSIRTARRTNSNGLIVKLLNKLDAK